LVLPDLLENSLLKPFDLKTAETIAPKEGGLNIEGLTATPEDDLLIGFRSPLKPLTLPQPEQPLKPIVNPFFRA
jgi:hypothetical protein